MSEVPLYPPFIPPPIDVHGNHFHRLEQTRVPPPTRCEIRTPASKIAISPENYTNSTQFSGEIAILETGVNISLVVAGGLLETGKHWYKAARHSGSNT